MWKAVGLRHRGNPFSLPRALRLPRRAYTRRESYKKISMDKGEATGGGWWWQEWNHRRWGPVGATIQHPLEKVRRPNGRRPAVTDSRQQSGSSPQEEPTHSDNNARPPPSSPIAAAGFGLVLKAVAIFLSSFTRFTERQRSVGDYDQQ